MGAYIARQPNGNRSPRQGIAVDLHVSRVEREGYRKMWVFGFVGRSRCITEHRPRFRGPRQTGDGYNAGGKNIN